MSSQKIMDSLHDEAILTEIDDKACERLAEHVMERYHYHRRGLESRNQAARCWGTFFLFAIPIYSLIITASARYLGVYETWGYAWTLVPVAITGLLTVLTTVNSIYRPVTRFHQTARELIEMNDWRTDLLIRLHEAKKKSDKLAAAEDAWKILHEADHKLSTMGRKVLKDILPKGGSRDKGSSGSDREPTGTQGKGE